MLTVGPHPASGASAMLIGCCALVTRRLPPLSLPRPLPLSRSPPLARSFATSPPSRASTGPGKVVQRLPVADFIRKNLLGLRCAINWRRDPHMKTAKSLYCICAEYPDHGAEWIGKGRLGLEDSFATWHGITSLHLWLVMQRLRAIGEQRLDASGAGGLPIDYPTAYVVYGMGRLFHRDIRQRLQDFPSYSRKSHAAAQLFNQFQHVNFLYKLTYQDSDLALAELLWRRVCICSPGVDAHSLQLLVRYVRANYRHLQSVSEADLLGGGLATFLPVEPRPTREATKAWMRERLKFSLAPQAALAQSDG